MPGENIQDWSVTAVNNGNSDTSINWAEGQPRASVNNSARSMMAAHAKDRNLHNGSIVTGGTANAQTFTSGVTYTTVPTGLRVLLKIGPSLTNTATATLEMDGLGAVGIKTMYATDLIGGELVADTYAEFVYNGTNWVLLRSKQSATPLGTITASGAASVQFTTSGIAAYDECLVVLSDVVPATNLATLVMQISLDSGATWKSGATDYFYAANLLSSAGTNLAGGAEGTIWYPLTGPLSNAVTCSVGGEVRLTAPHSSKLNPINSSLAYFDAVHLYLVTSAGMYISAASPINGIQFLMSSGNIASGTFTLYGIAK